MFQFGDWLGLDGVSETSFKGSTDDRYLGAVYYYRSAKLTAEAAEILGRQSEAEHYADLAGKIRNGILNEYFTPNGRFAMDTQASYVVALKFGLWIDRDRLIAQFKDRLKKDGYRIRCGFVPWVAPQLRHHFTLGIVTGTHFCILHLPWLYDQEEKTFYNRSYLREDHSYGRHRYSGVFNKLHC